MMTNDKSKGEMGANDTCTVHEPSRHNLLNQCHPSYPVVQCKTALLYVSGSRQITEFRVGQEGFSIYVWVKNMEGTEIHVDTYIPPEDNAENLWRMLEIDCKSGHARLSNRESVRGVGGNPMFRKQARAVDDIASVVNWIRRSEVWYEKCMSKQRRSVLKANNVLAAESGGSETRIPYMPVSMQREIAQNEQVNRAINSNVLPQHVSVGSVKHWDEEGCLAIRGKRTAGGLSNRTVIGKREMIERLREMAGRQLAKAAEFVETDPDEHKYYMELAQDTMDRAEKIQKDLNARMEKARAARMAKKASNVVYTGIEEAQQAMEEHIKREIEANAKNVDEATDAE